MVNIYFFHIITQKSKLLHTLEFRIDGTHRLLIIPLFATSPNLIQHSSFINFGEFCQPPFYSELPAC